MKPVLTSLLLMLLLAAPAAGQYFEAPNLLALMAGNPNVPYGLDSYRCLYGFGEGEVHLLLLNPMNESTGEMITMVGGFECRVDFPDHVNVLGVQLPPGCVNFLTAPEFLVGASIPVMEPQVLLATMTVSVAEMEAYSQYPAFINPVQPRYQSIEGFAAVADAEDSYSLSIAMAAEGDYEWPLFTFVTGAASPRPCEERSLA